MTTPAAILAAALAAQILPAPGAVRWEQVIDEPGGVSYIDPASLERDGDVVRFLNRSDRRAAENEVRMLVIRLAIDCRGRLIGMVESDLYGEGGRLLRSIPAQPGGVAFQPLAVAPGPDRVFRRVCAAAGGRR